MVFAAIAGMTACSGAEPDGTGGGGGSGEGGSGGSPTTSSTSGGVAGPGCPDLRGTFTCPLTGDPPEYTLTVAQTFDGEATTYQFHYSHNNMTATFAASAEGITTSTHVQKCAPYMGVPALTIFPQSAPDTVTYNFINPGDDYQADIAGGASVTCVRAQ